MKFIDKLKKDAEEKEKQINEQSKIKINEIVEKIDTLCEEAHKRGETDIIYSEQYLVHSKIGNIKLLDEVRKILENEGLTVTYIRSLTGPYNSGPYDSIKISWLKIISK